MVYEDGAGETSVPLAKVLRLFYNNMIKNEVEPEYTKEIIEKVSVMLCDDENSNDAATVLYNEVFAALGQPEALTLRVDKKPTVVIFIGPTGVGKTTTLAKIAANHALEKNLKVGLITADTYRIAAVEQLRTYAEILGMPLSVLYSPTEMKKALDEYRDKDLILIDTAGRSYRNKGQFEELKELISESCADEVYLVLSSTTSIRNNKEIINNYSFLDKYKLVFTKTDETPALGIMLNSRIMTGKALSYLTIGQGVPDDIEVASVDRITRNLIGSLGG
jgi:flagellar biosynthesis protein FlhF